MVIMGAATNVVTGYLVSRVELRTLVIISGFITIAAPVIMATIKASQHLSVADWDINLHGQANVHSVCTQMAA